METQLGEDPRTILRIGGAEAQDFLQGLVTNDIKGLGDGAVYSALLTAQGKYLSDFLMIADGDSVLVDFPAAQAEAVAQKLSMYRLRAKVTIEETGWSVARLMQDDAPEIADGAIAVRDPRDPGLGWRVYGPEVKEPPEAAAAWTARRIALGIPLAGVELTPGDGYILELGFERLNGVDFAKGCFVGQEIVARMKHKTELRKGLVPVEVTGSAPVGTEITRDGKTVGTLYSQAEGRGIAHLRFDRAGPGMVAGEAEVALIE